MTEETLLEAIEKMEKAVEHTQSQFATVRTGRATPAIVENTIIVRTKHTLWAFRERP